MRVLDIDLDFFIEGVAHWRDAGSDRLDAERYPPWAVGDALAYLERQCGLTRTLPGWAVEQHAEVFDRWHDAIALGVLTPPLSVTHVDAHADLGLGDAGYVYLMTDLLFRPVEERTSPHRNLQTGLSDGNWLMFAIACRWLSDLTYVFKGEDGRPGDLMEPLMEDRNMDADHIQLAAYTDEDFADFWRDPPPRPRHLEPKVPLTYIPWRDFHNEDPYDFICLTRSPEFTPAEADPIYDAIRDRFVDEVPLPPVLREEKRRQSRDW